MNVQNCKYIHILTNNHEKTNKKGGKKKGDTLPKPLPSFFFRPLLFLLPTTIYINKKIKKTKKWL